MDNIRFVARSFVLLTAAFVLCRYAPLVGAGPPDETKSIQTANNACQSCLTDGRLVDLTYPFDERTVYWPTEMGFKLERGKAGYTKLGYYYSANRFTAAEHGGTHVDAPIHFFKDRDTVDKIPLRRLIGAAVIVDVSKRCEENRDYQISIADLREWETRHGRQMADVIVLLRTGHGRFWPDRKSYLGTNKTGADAVKDLHFPGLAAEAAEWLVSERSIKAVGIDTASIDYGQSRRFQTHVTLCKHNVPALENVAHLEKLPEIDFSVIALPMKIGGGSGGPLRIIAIVPD